MPDDLIECSRCGYLFHSRLARLTPNVVLMQNCFEQCPNCKRPTRLPDGQIHGGKFFSFILATFIGRPNPIETAKEALSAVQKIAAEPTVEALEEAIKTEGLWWLNDILPADRNERRRAVAWIVDLMLKILPIIIAWAAYNKITKLEEDDVRKIVKEYNDTVQITPPSRAPTKTFFVKCTSADGMLHLQQIEATSESEAGKIATDQGLSVITIKSAD